MHTPTWLTHGLTLLAHAPLLEIIQLYTPDPLFLHPTAAAETDDFWHALVDTHGPHLTRVSVHRMAISLRAVEEVCVRCLALRQLFVVVDPMALVTPPHIPSSRISALADWDSPMTQDALAACLARAHVLAAVHINFPTTTTVVSSNSPSDRDPDVYTWLDVEVPVILKAPNALAIVRRCPPTITLFGCNACVWQVRLLRSTLI
jgi:hypothetical protein